ncbi:hypothetical protein Tco_0222128 [Tanacetum coccineum]
MEPSSSTLPKELIYKGILKASTNAEKGLKKIKEASPPDIQGILSYTNAEERVIVNEKYQEQTIIIGKQLPENFKEKLRNLLKSNADVFA